VKADSVLREGSGGWRKADFSRDSCAVHTRSAAQGARSASSPSSSSSSSSATQYTRLAVETSRKRLVRSTAVPAWRGERRFERAARASYGQRAPPLRLLRHRRPPRRLNTLVWRALTAWHACDSRASAVETSRKRLVRSTAVPAWRGERRFERAARASYRPPRRATVERRPPSLAAHARLPPRTQHCSGDIVLANGSYGRQRFLLGVARGGSNELLAQVTVSEREGGPE
jgi:hypothetical protein